MERGLTNAQKQIAAEFRKQLPSIVSGAEAKWFCEQCGMTFHVEKRFWGQAERTTCVESGCGVTFEHGKILRANGNQAVSVRIERRNERKP